MPLDEATSRLALQMQRELKGLAERQQGRVSRGEELRYDPHTRVARYETREGDLVSRLFGEPLAVYASDDRILRWSWAGRGAGADVSHADLVFREGQDRGVPQLSMSIVHDLDEDEAVTLGRLGALAAGAEAVHVRRSGVELELVGLFDRSRPTDFESVAGGRYSVPPPPAGERPNRDTPIPPRAPYRSLPPREELRETRESRGAVYGRESPPAAPALREPSRHLVLPVVNAILSGLTRACPGYRQALLVIIVDDHRAREGRRLVVQLVVIDARGALQALDVSTALLDAAAHLVDADRADGNAVWRKLSARIVPKPEGGASLHVDVV